MFARGTRVDLLGLISTLRLAAILPIVGNNGPMNDCEFV